jgi:hypothetical protein
MKMKLMLSGSWQCELEGEAEELARLLLALSKPGESFLRVDDGSTQARAVRPVRVGGANTTREAVLATMAYLGERGRAVAHISEIRSAFTHLFPQRSSRLVDQILRDLVNKTGQLNRVGRGYFRLPEAPGRVPKADGQA